MKNRDDWVRTERLSVSVCAWNVDHGEAEFEKLYQFDQRVVLTGPGQAGPAISQCRG
jgi:hypothetical protein